MVKGGHQQIFIVPNVLSALKLPTSQIFRSVLLQEHKSGHLVVRGGHQQIFMVLIVLSALKLPISQIFRSVLLQEH